MHLIKMLTGIVVASVLSSCYYNKRLVYLQDKRFSQDHSTQVVNQAHPYRLQTNDVISVKVKSATDSKISEIFNITNDNFATFSSPANLYIDGYSVENNGTITLPILGTLVVGGLTLQEAQDSIQNRANKYLNQATALVKLVSFKVTVLGEVKNPGYHYVYNNQVTVLEALGLAGDLTNFGNRRNIKLIRPTPDGSQVTLLDITDPNLLSSPYFFLMPNDVLYVEPLRARSSRSNLDLWGVVFSAATTAILVLSYMNSN